jgi:hypothetical protein
VSEALGLVRALQYKQYKYNKQSSIVSRIKEVSYATGCFAIV